VVTQWHRPCHPIWQPWLGGWFTNVYHSILKGDPTLVRRWVIFSVISIKLPCILPTFENLIRVGYNISPPRSNADNQHLPESLLTWMSFWVILHFWAPIWGGNSWTFPIPSLRPTSFEKGQTLEVWSDSKQAGQAKEMAPTPRCEWCDWMWLEYTYIYTYIHISVSICIYLRIYIYSCIRVFSLAEYEW